MRPKPTCQSCPFPAKTGSIRSVRQRLTDDTSRQWLITQDTSTHLRISVIFVLQRKNSTHPLVRPAHRSRIQTLLPLDTLLSDSIKYPITSSHPTKSAFPSYVSTSPAKITYAGQVSPSSPLSSPSPRPISIQTTSYATLSLHIFQLSSRSRYPSLQRFTISRSDKLNRDRGK